MTDPDDLQHRVTAIINADDDEAQHSLEDALLAELVREFAPAWVVAEVDRLADADFERWCA